MTKAVCPRCGLESYSASEAVNICPYCGSDLGDESPPAPGQPPTSPGA